jgi:uncharacterized protein
MSEISFAALVFSVGFVIFFRLPKLAFGLLALALGSAFWEGRVGLPGLGLVVATALLAYAYYLRAQKTVWKLISAVLFTVCTALLAMRVFPLFQNWQVIPPFKLSELSTPYAIWWNFEKPILAVVIAGFVALRSREIEFPVSNKKVAALSLFGIILTIFLAVFLGYIVWEPKFPPVFWVWALTNLFITCAGEEALFRGFILRETESMFQNKTLKRLVPLLLSSAAFGLVHFAGGPKYIFLASVAGIFYGLIFQMTGKLRYSIGLHLALNATHFLLFTYPALQQ